MSGFDSLGSTYVSAIIGIITFESRASKVNGLGPVSVLGLISIVDDDYDISEFGEGLHVSLFLICICKWIHWISYKK